MLALNPTLITTQFHLLLQQRVSMAFGSNPDQDWEILGKTNPYFGVLSDPKFLDQNLTDDSIHDFFTSGEPHVEHVFDVIRTRIRPDFTPSQVLDYGCGVGRLVIPFARRGHAVVGIDISHGMLERAKENCDKFNASSVRLLHVSQLDSLAPNSFDLVHSFIVFQHIPVGRGELILRKLISLIAEGGVGAIHLTYADVRPPFNRGLLAMRKHVRFVHGLVNLAKGRPFSTPMMQMNSYSLNRIFNILMDERCSNLHIEFSEHGGFRGAMLYFEKSPKPLL
jgi:SAM-dependent methyltransferase